MAKVPYIQFESYVPGQRVVVLDRQGRKIEDGYECSGDNCPVSNRYTTWIVATDKGKTDVKSYPTSRVFSRKTEAQLKAEVDEFLGLSKKKRS